MHPQVLQLFSKHNTLSGTTLQGITSDYPYFELAHIAAGIASPKQAKYLYTASLYTQNNTWLHYLIQQHIYQVPTIHSRDTVEQEPVLHDANALANTAQVLKVQEPPTQPIVSVTEQEPELVADLATQPIVSSTEQEPEQAADLATQPIVSIIEQEPEQAADLATQPVEIITVQEPEQVADLATQPAESINEQEPEQAADLATQPAESITEQEPEQVADLDTEDVTNMPIPTLNISTNPTLNVAQPSLSAITFEPYYTVDYFAAQGIKPKPQEADKLTVQLRSFTDWLKTMRKINVPEPQLPNTQANHIQPNEDKAVTVMANNSLVTEDILTETMADVLVKQGRIDEAITLLHKLSLQDTEKSGYFAIQIKALKEQL